MLSLSWKLFQLRVFLEFTRWELPTFDFVCWHCPRNLDCLVIWSHLCLLRWKLDFNSTESFSNITVGLVNCHCRGMRSPDSAVL